MVELSRDQITDLLRDWGRGDPEAALSLWDRAAEADPADPAPRLAAAEILVGLGRHREAEERLEDALERDAYHAAAALRLAELRLERGGDAQRILPLARLAVRFGGRAGEAKAQAEATLAAAEARVTAATAAVEAATKAVEAAFKATRALGARSHPPSNSPGSLARHSRSTGVPGFPSAAGSGCWGGSVPGSVWPGSSSCCTGGSSSC